MGVALYGVNSTATALKISSTHYLVASPEFDITIPSANPPVPTPFRPQANSMSAGYNSAIVHPTDDLVAAPPTLPVDSAATPGSTDLLATPPALPESTPLAYLPTEVAALINPISPVEVPELLPTATPTPTETPLPTPTIEVANFSPLDQLQVPVKLILPGLEVKRTIVSVGLIETSTGPAWDSDSLFATENRPDLVGHLQGSAFPGEGGNTIFIGHNYDWGIYRWKGVFADLKKLSPGDEIIVILENGQEVVYIVEEIKVLPWSKQNSAELEKHNRFLSPSNYEKITLVTCSGANMGIWNKRVYVVAVPRGD